MTGAAGCAALLRAALFWALAAGLAACAQPARVGGMVVADDPALSAAAADHPLRHAIALGEVGGGEDTNPLWTSEVGNEEFAQALRLSLEAHGLLAPVPSASPYVLDAELEKVGQPGGGLALTVTSTVTYRLMEIAGGAQPMLRYEDTVTAPYTAELSDSILMVERLRLANEGSIRENVSIFIARLLDVSRALPEAGPGGAE